MQEFEGKWNKGALVGTPNSVHNSRVFRLALWLKYLGELGRFSYLIYSSVDRAAGDLLEMIIAYLPYGMEGPLTSPGIKWG